MKSRGVMACSQTHGPGSLPEKQDDAGPVSITAIVTAWRRLDELLHCLGVIISAKPPPAEVLVHLDAGASIDPAAVGASFPEVRFVISHEPVGPGGGRNKLIQTAANELVASFDDDSFPDQADFFAQAVMKAAQHPEAAILAAVIVENEQQFVEANENDLRVRDFVGCGCVYRRSAFMRTNGYVPVPLAYGVEEVDLAIRLHDIGAAIVRVPSLKVRHMVQYAKYEDPAVTSASIANIALLAFLRYPLVLWPLGALQCIRRAIWLFSRGRWRGILEGFLVMPRHLRKYAAHRSPLSSTSILSFFLGRRSVRHGAEPSLA